MRSDWRTHSFNIDPHGTFKRFQTLLDVLRQNIEVIFTYFAFIQCSKFMLMIEGTNYFWFTISELQRIDRNFLDPCIFYQLLPFNCFIALEFGKFCLMLLYYLLFICCKNTIASEIQMPSSECLRLNFVFGCLGQCNIGGCSEL